MPTNGQQVGAWGRGFNVMAAEIPRDLSTQRTMEWSRILDSSRRYLTDRPTPSRFATLLKSVDEGDIAAICELAEEMEAKDGHLQGVAARRREALTALDWSIEPDPAAVDQAAAAETAKFCQRTLESLPSWPETLEHISEAIGPGIAVFEQVWRRGRLKETVDVPGDRLTGPIDGGPGVFVETDANYVEGVEAKLPKFVVHTPNWKAGHPLRVTPIRAEASLWVIKHYGVADWATFAERFGLPIPIAKTKGAVDGNTRTLLESMLKNLASDGWAVLPEEVELEISEASRASQPFKDLIDWVERKESILWLGQTLTTEQQSVGSLALGQVHDNVRASITLSDMQQESRTIRYQVLRPMVRFRWPEKPDAPIPTFQRRIIEQKNLDADRLTLDKFRYMDEKNLSIDDDFRYEALGIPQPKHAP